MKSKARFKNIFRTIKNTLNRFLAITAIVALGAGFLGGLMATSPDMKASADSYMDKYDWYDLDIVNRLGFTQEEIELVKGLDEIDQLQEGIVCDDVFLTADKKRLTSRLFGLLPENDELKINRFELKEGKLPEKADQCLVQLVSSYSASAPKVGEKLTVIEGSGGNYRYKSVTVSGLIESPMYFSAELEPSAKGSGSLEIALYLHPAFFINQNTNHLFISLKGAKEKDTWSSEYKNQINEMKEKINSLLCEKVYLRFDSLSQNSLSLEEIFSSAEKADRMLYSAEKNLYENHNKTISLLEKNNPQSPLLEILKEDKQGISQPDENRTAYENVENSVEELFSSLSAFRENIFSVQDRSQSTGYSSYKDNVEKIASLSKVFPAFFFFIALLVALTTMTRLVEEKRGEIGTLKSLGFSSFQLLGQYLLYAFLSSLLGSAIGLVIGFKLFPTAVSLSYSMMYSVPPGFMPFRWNIALPVSGIATGVILLATAAACIPETLARPAILMSPKAPAPGKRVFLEYIKPVWKRLSFSRKVTVRNMLRYKKRLFMTIAGVAGCSALLVAGFGLRDSLQDIITVQFDDITTFNVSLMLKDSKSFEKDEVIKNILNDKTTVSSYMKVAMENVSVIKDGKSLVLQLYVPEDESRINDFMVLRKRKNHEALSLNDEGIIITEKQTELLGIKDGDYVTLQTEEGKSSKVKVISSTECYMYGNVYATQNMYKKIFGHNPDFKAALCNLTAEKNNQQTISALMESPGVIYAMWIDSLVGSAHKSISAINIVVFVIIITSGLLSIIVLYNLANINICERKREIATLLVLGYTEKEARRYIFREINLLSLSGTFIGLFLGGPLHAVVVHATEVNVIMWGRSVHPLSYVFAVLVSVIFTILVNLIMKKSVTKIDMVESLKTKD